MPLSDNQSGRAAPDLPSFYYDLDRSYLSSGRGPSSTTLHL